MSSCKTVAALAVVVAAGAFGAVTQFPPDGDWTAYRIERRGKAVRFVDTNGRTVLSAIGEPSGVSLDGVGFALEKDALVVDAAGAMRTGGVRKIVFTTPNLAVGDFAGRECTLIAEATGGARGARASFFYEGHGPGKIGHFHESKRAPLATFRRAYRLGSTVPEAIGSLHVRFDINETAGAPVRFNVFRWGPAAELPYYEKRPERHAELLFRADFDGTADAAFAKGEAKARMARGLEFVPGRKGLGVRLTKAANSLLAYGFKDNVVPESGTVAMWVRREWPDSGYDAKKAAVYRMLFSTPVPKPRFGSGALITWFHGPVFRGDPSDLEDHYEQATLPVDGNWVHLAMSWDESGVRLALNGKYPGCAGCGDSDSLFKRVLDNPDGLGFDRVTFDRFFVGCREGVFQLDGVIDDFRIYSAPLDDVQLAALYGELATEADNRIEQPDYRRLFAGQGANPYVGGNRLDLELVESVKFDGPAALDALAKADRFSLVGPASYGRIGDRPYFECAGKEGSRFALRLDLEPAKQPLYCVEIDYPDDKVRTIDFIVQDARSNSGDYTMQVGVAAGGEWPNTGRMLTHRCLLWARAPRVALVGMTARADAPAAVSEVRLYKVRDSKLPPLKVAEPEPNADGWNRSFALYFEDPAIGYDFAVPSDGFTADSLSTLIDRTVADMKYTGENLFAYPGVWYQGRICEDYNPRNHAPDFLSAWYEKFDREGLTLMPTINPNNMPVRRGLVTREALVDGSLHATPVSIHDTGKPNWGGWHGTPPNYNIAHPDTQKWLDGLVDVLLAQGKGHPSFKGLCLHVTRHNMLTFGGIEAGYNDYCIDAFEKAKGVKVPADRANPLRGAKYAAWIKANAKEAWLEWRCEVVTAFWGRIARKLKAARPDLKLWINAFSISRIRHDDFLKDDWVAIVNREMGVDPVRLRAAADNIIVGQSVVPADYRWRKASDFPAEERATRRAKQRDLYRLGNTWELLKDGLFPWAGQHDRYWESAIGATGVNDGDWTNTTRKNAANSLDSKWMKECPWRVTTINPSGRHALAHFAAPFAFGDILGLSKGGFLIGTYGMEDELREFMAAFRALPAVVMADIPVEGRPDAVRYRGADFRGMRYLYVVNTGGNPETCGFRLPKGAVNLVTGADEGLACPALKPYELRSYRVEGVRLACDLPLRRKCRIADDEPAGAPVDRRL